MVGGIGMSRSTKILDRRFVPAGTKVIQEGTLGHCAFTIESGKLEVYTTDSDGKTVVISELGPGAIVGEIALMTGKHRNASVRVVEDAILVAVTSHELKHAVGASESFYKKMVLMMMGRIKDTAAKISNKTGSTP